MNPEPQPVGVDAQDIINRLSRELAQALTRAVIAEAAQEAVSARLDEAMASRLQGDG